MSDVILFGGTSESRVIAQALNKRNIRTIMCVATEYGESLAEQGRNFEIRSGRMDSSAIEDIIKKEQPAAVIDATHPYSVIISDTVEKICALNNCRYIRIIRESIPAQGADYFDSFDELITYLNGTDGIIFSAFGSKEAEILTGVKDFQKRVVLRTLPSEESVGICLRAGFPAKNIICMQGPFSEELNYAMFKEVHADILITKESGRAGGFEEKINAAKRLGMKIGIIKRPAEKSGISLDEAIKMIETGTL